MAQSQRSQTLSRRNIAHSHFGFPPQFDILARRVSEAVRYPSAPPASIYPVWSHIPFPQKPHRPASLTFRAIVFHDAQHHRNPLRQRGKNAEPTQRSRTSSRRNIALAHFEFPPQFDILARTRERGRAVPIPFPRNKSPSKYSPRLVTHSVFPKTTSPRLTHVSGYCFS